MTWFTHGQKMCHHPAPNSLPLNLGEENAFSNGVWKNVMFGDPGNWLEGTQELLVNVRDGLMHPMCARGVEAKHMLTAVS